MSGVTRIESPLLGEPDDCLTLDLRGLNPMTAPQRLASAIQDEHAACEADAWSSLVHAIRCGDLLIEAKALCAHGEFLSWVEENTGSVTRLPAGT